MTAEQQFKAKYPYAHAKQTAGRPYEMFTVFAGDYVCAAGHTKAEAYKLALDYEERGLITPDPQERATC